MSSRSKLFSPQHQLQVSPLVTITSRNLLNPFQEWWKFCYRTTLLKMYCTGSNTFAIQEINLCRMYTGLHKKQDSWIIMCKIWPMWRLRTAFLPKTFENVKTTPLYFLNEQYFTTYNFLMTSRKELRLNHSVNVESSKLKSQYGYSNF